MGTQIYTMVKLAVDDRSMFEREGCLAQLVEAELNINRTSTGYGRLL